MHPPLKYIRLIKYSGLIDTDKACWAFIFAAVIIINRKNMAKKLDNEVAVIALRVYNHLWPWQKCCASINFFRGFNR
jgi:hypothetical protein